MNVSEATVTKQGHHLARIYMGQTLHLNKIKYFIIYISGQQGVAKGADNIYTIWCAMTHAKSKTKYGLGMGLSNFFKMYHHFLFSEVDEFKENSWGSCTVHHLMHHNHIRNKNIYGSQQFSIYLVFSCFMESEQSHRVP